MVTYRPWHRHGQELGFRVTYGPRLGHGFILGFSVPRGPRHGLGPELKLRFRVTCGPEDFGLRYNLDSGLDLGLALTWVLAWASGLVCGLVVGSGIAVGSGFSAGAAVKSRFGPVQELRQVLLLDVELTFLKNPGYHLFCY